MWGSQQIFRSASMSWKSRASGRSFLLRWPVGYSTRERLALNVDVITSLFLIVVAAFAAPLICQAIPKRVIPEVVLLLAFGVLIGPHGLAIASESPPIELVSELGLGFLFLLAGYEIDTNEFKGRGGAVASVSWGFSLLLAFGVAYLVFDLSPFGMEGAATAIVMTTTAIGTMFPILKERGVLGTPIGKSVMTHGAVGEIGPILAMAILLSVRDEWLSVLVVAIFLLATIIIGFIPAQTRKVGSRIVRALHMGAESTAQTTVRGTVVLLVGLVTLAAVLELDIVLGAFAAGFIVRQALPQGRVELEKKLDGLAYGLFIPVFFVTSGMHINVSVAIDEPIGWIFFLVMFVLVRGLPVFFSTFAQTNGKRHSLTMGDRVATSLYSATALPIVVAVTAIAEEAGAMSNFVASSLVLAGAASVLVLPLIAQAIPITGEESSRAPARGDVTLGVDDDGVARDGKDPAAPKPAKPSHDVAWDEDDAEAGAIDI